MNEKTATSLNLTGTGEHLPQGHANLDEKLRGISERHSHEDVNGSINPIQTQIKNDYQCPKCQSTTSNPTNSSDQSSIRSTCEHCDQKSFHSNVYKKGNDSSKMHIPIPFSARKKNIINELSTLNENMRSLKDTMIRIQNSLHRINEECSSIRNSFQQQNNATKALAPNQDALQQELLSLKQKLEDLHYENYDGSLIWKIDDCTEKFQQAISDQTTSIYSPAFYSSGSGYKMRARLDLYGDGDVRGTHISIFLVICKGDFDPILSWPFNFAINFCLFDQTGEDNHIVDSFRPDGRSVSFRRPTSDRNVPSGILKFCPWDAFQQEKQRYVQQDKMFIKISLDFFDTPRSILAQTLSINPAQPSLEQEAIRYRMIQEHKETKARLVAAINQASQEVAKSILILAPRPITASGREKRKSSATNSECVMCEEILQKDRTKDKK